MLIRVSRDADFATLFPAVPDVSFRVDWNALISNEELDAVARDVFQLSSLFTRSRERLPSSYLRNERLRKAYLSYFIPSNILKIHLPLRELALHPFGMFRKPNLHILDLGSGPGTALLGVLDFFSQKPEPPNLQLVAVDKVKENLHDARNLHRTWTEKNGINTDLRTVHGDLKNAVKLCQGAQYDLILLCNSLNELFQESDDRIKMRSDFLNQVIRRLLSENGSCIVIDPALHETSRDLLSVRDDLIAKGFHVYSPCLVQEPCPALQHPNDWCHEDRHWDPPEIVKAIDSRIGLRKDSLKFSYIVLRKDSLSLTDCFSGTMFRVVSEPLVSKGKIEFYVCGSGGRRLATRLDKHRSPENTAFEQLQRGDIVAFENFPDAPRIHIEPDTRVRIL